jgi:hypothetical protein
MNGRQWTSEEDNALKEWWMDGVYTKIIARRLNRAPSSISRRVDRLALPRRVPLLTQTKQLRISMTVQQEEMIRAAAHERGVPMNKFVWDAIMRAGGDKEQQAIECGSTST